MATSVMQIRVDDELRAEAAAVYEKLGIDTPTAIRMFLKRSVLENGIPFSMVLPKESSAPSRGVRALKQLGEEAAQNGTAELSLDDINAEISAARHKTI